MCGLICEPRPSRKRPFENVCRSLASTAVRHGVAGEGHRDAGAELDAFGVLGGQQQGEERVVARLGAPQAVEAVLLGSPRRLDGVARIEADSTVDLHRAHPIRSQSGAPTPPAAVILVLRGRKTGVVLLRGGREL